MKGIHTVTDLIERLQKFPGESTITAVNMTPGEHDRRMAIFGVGPFFDDTKTVMLAMVELPVE